MTTLHPFLAQADLTLDDLLKQEKKAGGNLRQYWIFWGALLLVVVLALGWAVFIRKRNRRTPGFHHAHHGGRVGIDSSAALNGATPGGESGHRRKRRRRAHRPRNPTLAESGGLPPVREDPPAEPSA